MIQNRLVVYKAGAGSGKTFQIAKRYLNHLIQAQNSQIIYRLIGITFTNKAAEEMKKRIIDNLINASQGQITDVMAVVSQESEHIIKEQTGITEAVDYQQEIIKRSQQRLTEILHYYDEFQLTTIDKLMYRIIKTFARDMHLSTDVEVEMEYREVVDMLIDKLINRAEQGSLLSRFFIDFAIEKIEDEKNWKDIKQDLNDISKIIFNDNYFDALKSLENKTLDDFKRLRDYLIKEKNQLRKDLIEQGNALATQVETYKSHVYSDVHTYIKRLRFEHQNIVIKPRLQSYIDQGIYYKKDAEKKLDNQGFIELEVLNNEIHRVITKSFKKNEQLKFINALLDEVNALSIENELQKEIADFKETHNRIFISDFNKLILEQILKDLATNTPYIYMRLGEKYAHYFIDEFQDTSALQWHNLIPLVREALSKEFAGGHLGSAMLVGDAKQSIYRFRGGKPEQFIALSDPEQQSGEGNPFAALTRKSVEELAFNWRSKAQIIKFNNDFFKNFVRYLPEPYRQVYIDPSQKIPAGKDTGEGYVNIRFLNRKEEIYEEAVYEAIIQAQQNGFQKEEICILINRNSEGRRIAEYLSQNDIDVVSSETLLVVNAGKVKFLMSWLYFLVSGNPADLYDAVRFLAERDQKSKPESYESLINEQKLTKTDQVKKFEKIGYYVDYERLIKFNLYDILIYLIDVFKLSDQQEQAYLQAFLEKVYQFSQKDLPTIKAFLNEWITIAHKFSIAAPDKKGAVKIMTVHKAKGLEFPVVIYYTDEAVLSSKDKETKVWIPLNPADYQGFKTLPIRMGALENASVESYQNIYEQTASEKTFDNLNRIYVALTRAVEQLYVITFAVPDKPKNLKVSQVFYDYLTQNFPEFDGQTFEYGTPDRLDKKPVSEAEALGLNRLYYKNWQLKQQDNFLKINTFSLERWSEHKKSAILYGLQLHDILSQVTTAAQWQQQKDKLLSGLETDLKTKIAGLVEKILHLPDLKTYFSDDYQILNERAILIPSDKGIFKQKRPDRLLITNDKITIIDYKTGAEEPKHIKQLQVYADYLTQAGFEVENLILIYIGKEVTVKFV